MTFGKTYAGSIDTTELLGVPPFRRRLLASDPVDMDQLERRLRQRLNALGPAPHAELLHVLVLPDFDRADAIGEFWGNAKTRTFAELLIDCEEDRTPAQAEPTWRRTWAGSDTFSPGRREREFRLIISSYAAAEQGLRRWLLEHADVFQPSEGTSVYVARFLERARRVYVKDGVYVDLGGGVSPLNGALAASGMGVTVFDILGDYFSYTAQARSAYLEEETSGDFDPAPQLAVLRDAGVNLIQADLLKVDLTEHFEQDSVDCVATYHTLEHLDDSPRRLLESAVSVLKPGGVLAIEVPNAANLLKRLRLLLGRTNYERYELYYDSGDAWYGHVREYTVGDLRILARRLGLSWTRLEGMNWIGALYAKFPDRLARLVDTTLRLRPGLCASLFIRLTKATSGMA